MNTWLPQSVDEAELLEDHNEIKDEEFKLSAEQLKMQRDMLRAELAKSLEHKKKTDQYSMEAKQHAQRVMYISACIYLLVYVCLYVCLSVCVGGFNRGDNWAVVTPICKNWVPSYHVRRSNIFASCPYSNGFVRYERLFTPKRVF